MRYASNHFERSDHDDILAEFPYRLYVNLSETEVLTQPLFGNTVFLDLIRCQSRWYYKKSTNLDNKLAVRIGLLWLAPKR